MKKNIFVALDFNSLEKALDVTKKLKDEIAGIKIGTELYTICGIEGIKKFKELGVEIFLDLKLCVGRCSEFGILPSSVLITEYHDPTLPRTGRAWTTVPGFREGGVA